MCRDVCRRDFRTRTDALACGSVFGTQLVVELSCGTTTTMRSNIFLVAVLASWAVPPSAAESGRFTDSLVEDVRETWESVINHEFTDQLAEGTLDLKTLKCYLIQDHRFIDAFVVLLSSMIAHARNLEDRIPGGRFLGLIVGQENTYFERSFKALGVTARDREQIPDAPAMTAFQTLMRDAAKSGSLAQMLAVLVVAEWSYQSWGERVLPKAVEGPFYFREWVDLHSGEYFGCKWPHLSPNPVSCLLFPAGSAGYTSITAQILRMCSADSVFVCSPLIRCQRWWSTFGRCSIKRARASPRPMRPRCGRHLQRQRGWRSSFLTPASTQRTRMRSRLMSSKPSCDHSSGLLHSKGAPAAFYLLNLRPF